MATLSELRANIKAVKADLDGVRHDIKLNATKITHKTITGLASEASLPYDFDKNQKKMEDLYEEYARLKNKLQCYNNSTMIDFEGEPINLSNAIILSKELNSLMNDYNYLLDKKPYIKRVNSMFANSESYYEEVQLRFDVDVLTEIRDRLRGRINTLDMLIDKANAETLVKM